MKSYQSVAIRIGSDFEPGSRPEIVVARAAPTRVGELEAMAERIEELVLANRRKDEFLAVLSHELRSPLASIQYGVGVLRGRSGTEPTVQRGMHELIDRQVRQMSVLAAGLLDIGRITSGHLLVQLERVDLRAVLSNAIETLEPDFKIRGQVLESSWAPASVWVMADAARLEQVFINLLANASKYTDIGGKIALSLSIQGAVAMVCIKDSGIGIAAQALPTVFDLYMQVDAASTRSRSGMGIGLALVRTIVELHGGKVTAASGGLGKGSEFIVRLPRA